MSSRAARGRVVDGPGASEPAERSRGTLLSLIAARERRMRGGERKGVHRYLLCTVADGGQTCLLRHVIAPRSAGVAVGRGRRRRAAGAGALARAPLYAWLPLPPTARMPNLSPDRASGGLAVLASRGPAGTRNRWPPRGSSRR